jgi:hypothetical protein
MLLAISDILFIGEVYSWENSHLVQIAQLAICNNKIGAQEMDTQRVSATL